MNDNHLLLTLGGVGAALGIGQLLASQDRITARVIIGRAIISGGLGLAAGAALTVLPNLNHVALAGIAALFASLGASSLERAFQQALGARRNGKG